MPLLRRCCITLLAVVNLALSPVGYQATVQAATMPRRLGAPVSVQTNATLRATGASKTTMPISDLRVTLDMLLSEHLLLVASAANARFAGRMADFQAATAAIYENTQAVAAAMGSIYGQDAEAAFLPLWRAYIGSLLDYTTGVAQQDEDKQNRALADLTQFAQDFYAFLEAANPQLADDVMAPTLLRHVNQLIATINALAIPDYPTALTALQEAWSAMDGLAGTLAGALGEQFPDRFDGAAAAPAANLHTSLTMLLAEHVYLATMATDAALGNRQAEAEAVAVALDYNAQALAAVVGAVDGEETSVAFLAQWRAYTDLLGDYAARVLAADRGQKDQTLAKLMQATQALSAFLVDTNPRLSQAALSELWTPHVQLMTAVIDAQVAGQPQQAYANLRQGYRHMRSIGDLLAAGMVVQFPQRFDQAIAAEPPNQAAPMIMDTLPAPTGLPIVTNITQSLQPTAPSVAAGLLRAQLDNLLGEHVLLATSTTEAILRGRQADEAAAALALDSNTVALAATFRSLYGEQAENDFLARWRQQIDFFNAYATGLATQDQAEQAQAQTDLDQFATDFGLFMSTLNPNLSAGAQVGLMHEHVQNLLTVIAAQAAATPQDSGDQQAAYPALQTAYAQVDQLSTALVVGIAQQFSTRFVGDAQSAAADLRASLNLELGEHIYLLAKSTAAALNARNVEFEAAAGALDQNSRLLAATVASIYGEQAGADFLVLWRRHIGIFIDYTLAQVEDDNQARTQAIADLARHADDLSLFLHTANPAVDVATLTPLLKTHADTTLAVIDAAAQEDYSAYYTATHQAYDHMAMLANPLAGAIVVQFPEQFAGEIDASTVVQ